MNKGVNEPDRVFNRARWRWWATREVRAIMWLRSLGTFQGKVYSVQIDPNELAGIEALGVENHFALQPAKRLAYCILSSG